jgi:methyl-accepting chemotaxis protein
MDWLPIFVALTAVAILLQAGILLGMYLAIRKTSANVEAISLEVKTKALPALDTAREMLIELRPQIANIVANVNESATTVRNQVQRLDATVSDAVDRARLQVIRADEMVSKTMDKVEETTEMVQNTVVSPIRRLSGVFHGLSVGMEVLLGARRRPRGRDGVGVPQDEMFI